MKPRRSFPCADVARSASRRGFTLLELLTSIAILSIILTFLANMTGAVGKTWLGGQRQVNNLTKARAMMELMVRDIQAGVYRADLPAFPDLSGTVAFYSMRTSMGGSRGVSLVTYALDGGDLGKTTLNRGDMAVNWGDPATCLTFGTASAKQQEFINKAVHSTTSRETAYGIVGFKLAFTLADGTRVETFPGVAASNPARSVGMTLAVIDDKTLKRLSSENIQGIRSGLSAALTAAPDETPKQVWEKYLADPSHWSAYPGGVAAGIKIFERYVPLPYQ